MDKEVFNRLKATLSKKLRSGCESGAEILRDNTPIDTKRLWESTRVEDEESTSNNSIQYRIVAGGIELYGINRETDISREVDYAIFVESRTHYARNSLPQIKKTIIDNLG